MEMLIFFFSILLELYLHIWKKDIPHFLQNPSEQIMNNLKVSLFVILKLKIKKENNNTQTEFTLHHPEAS